MSKDFPVEKYRINNYIDDYVIWNPDYGVVNTIDKEIQDNGYYELDLDLKRSENRDGNLISVFLQENGILYILRGGIKIIKDSRIHTKITAIDRILLARYFSKNFKKNEQYSDKTKQIFERFRYPLFTTKPDEQDYRRYVGRMIMEYEQIGLRRITLSTKYYIVYHFFHDVSDEIREAINTEGSYPFPHSSHTFEMNNGSEILEDATFLISCPGQYYLVTPEYNTDDSQYSNILIKDIEPIVLEDGCKQMYEIKMQVHAYNHGQFELFKRRKIRFPF